MLFILSKAVEPMLWPLNVALILLACAIVFRRRRALTIAAFAVLFIASTPIFTQHFRYVWENTYPSIPFADYPTRDVIVVLGGTMLETRAPRLMPEEANGARVLTAWRLYRAGKSPAILCSGGVPYIGIGGQERMEADDMCDLLHEWGVPEEKLIRERLSRTTYENARYSLSLLQQQGKMRILLVTTAMHLKRATALYRKAGFDVTPVPNTWYMSEGVRAKDFLPDVQTLFGNTQWMKEVIGYYFFKLVGKA